MNRVLLASAVCAYAFLTGCEDKPAPTAAPAPKPTSAATNAVGDAMKAAGDKAKEAGAAVSDALKKEVTSMVDKAKAQVDQLKNGAASVPADKKSDFEKAMGDINSQFKSLSDGASTGLKDLTGDGLSKKLTELKDMGSKLMTNIKSTADKFGIKLN